MSSKVQLHAILCNGPAVSDGSVDIGNCTTFKSSSSTPIPENQWTYFGFTYQTYNKIGTFIINQVYGYEDGTTVYENHHFTFNAKFWLSVNQGFGANFRIGSEANDFQSDSQSFSGKLSCLQIYDLFLKPSQMQHVANCPVESRYTRMTVCPSGHTLLRGHCYWISSKDDTFSNAEYTCIDNGGNIGDDEVHAYCLVNY